MLINLENPARSQSAGLSTATPVVAIVGATGAVGVELPFAWQRATFRSAG
jgi:hypothetical protein